MFLPIYKLRCAPEVEENKSILGNIHTFHLLQIKFCFKTVLWGARRIALAHGAEAGSQIMPPHRLVTMVVA